ncbi:MAG: GDP-mannose 4,6-dehydratase [Bacteroidales bacterium]|nr:GDP-mannose 4,6-dehydratase [Bacteroidales bacterium]
MNILITGGAGFIGSNLIDFLLDNTNYNIISIDNFDNFYSKKHKLDNIKNQFNYKNFKFYEIDITNKDILFAKLTENYDVIIHLAAKAGVRPSILNPIAYIKTNVEGTQNILDLAKSRKTKKVISASSSSIYGDIEQFPWNEGISNFNPISPYAVSKIAGENLGKVFSNLYNIQYVALRFFTVYGPRQRPDLAIRKFIDSIEKNKTISLFGDGTSSRDYTYIDDILSGVVACLDYEKKSFDVFNLGNNYSVSLFNLVKTIEQVLNKKAKIEFLPFQKGDLKHTLSNISKANIELNYAPQTSLKEGIEKFYNWYKQANNAK